MSGLPPSSRELQEQIETLRQQLARLADRVDALDGLDVCMVTPETIARLIELESRYL